MKAIYHLSISALLISCGQEESNSSLSVSSSEIENKEVVTAMPDEHEAPSVSPLLGEDNEDESTATEESEDEIPDNVQTRGMKVKKNNLIPSAQNMEEYASQDSAATVTERYNNGQGAPSDSKQAIQWYKEFADAGIADAQYKLADCYFNTRSVPFNFVKAVENYRAAAEQGHQEACRKLAECYYKGIGVEVSLDEARKWQIAAGDAPSESSDSDSYYTITAKASVTGYKAGEPFYIALNGKVADTYHAYWRNPGSVGEPITATLTAPGGFKVEGPYWEVPHRVEGSFSVAYSYEAPIAVWKVTPEANTPQQAEFTIESAAQTCNDMGCNPAETKTTTVTLSAGEPAVNPEWTAEETKVETLGDTPAIVTATQTTQSVTLLIDGVDSIEHAYFFSEDNAINPTATQELKKTDSGYSLTLPRNDNKDPMHPVADETLVGKNLSHLKGLLIFGQYHITVYINFNDM